MNKLKNGKVTKTFWLDQELADQLEEIRRRDERTLSATVARLLKVGVDDWLRQNPSEDGDGQ